MGAETPTVVASTAENIAVVAVNTAEAVAPATEVDERMLVISGFCQCTHCWSTLQEELNEFAPGVVINEVVKTLSTGKPKGILSTSFQTTWSVLRIVRANPEGRIAHPFAGVPTAVDEAGFRLLQPAREIQYGK